MPSALRRKGYCERERACVARLARHGILETTCPPYPGMTQVIDPGDPPSSSAMFGYEKAILLLLV